MKEQNRTGKVAHVSFFFTWKGSMFDEDRHSSRRSALDSSEALCGDRAHGGGQGGSAPSTGFLALMAALSVCERVTVYGFSREASRDAKSSSFSYHYFKVRSGRAAV